MWQSEYDQLNSFQQIVEIMNLQAQHEQACREYRKQNKKDVPWLWRMLNRDAVLVSEEYAFDKMDNTIMVIHDKYRYLVRKIDQAKIAAYSNGDK